MAMKILLCAFCRSYCFIPTFRYSQNLSIDDDATNSKIVSFHRIVFVCMCDGIRIEQILNCRISNGNLTRTKFKLQMVFVWLYLLCVCVFVGLRILWYACNMPSISFAMVNIISTLSISEYRFSLILPVLFFRQMKKLNNNQTEHWTLNMHCNGCHLTCISQSWH